MSDSSPDEIFKNTLRDYLSPVPDDMWERISRKKNRRKLFWFFWLLTLGLFAVSALAYVVLSGSTSDKANNIQQKEYHASTSADENDSSATHEVDSPAANDETMRVNVVGKNSVAGSGEHTTSTSVVKSTVHEASSSDAGSVVISSNGTSAHNLPNTDKTQVGPTRINAAATSGSNTIATTNKKNLPDITFVSKKANSVLKTDTSRRSDTKAKAKDTIKTKSNWWIDLYASPDYPFISDAPLLSINQPKISYTIGIAVTRSLGTHFSIKAGIQYSQINFINKDSNLIAYKYHLKTLDVPVILGYAFGKGKLKFMIDAGCVFNIHTYTDSLSAFFKHNTGFSLYGGLNIALPVNEKISVFAEPYYRYRLSSMTFSSVPYDKFIDIAGISLGMRYYFLNPSKK
jgi:hypothetical protein